jgi:hypothetical protein
VLSRVEDPAAKRTCRISLRFTHDRDNRPLPAPKIIPFGDVLDDSNKVEETLRRAQAGVLELPFSHDSSVDRFLNPSYQVPDRHPVDFSRNVVRVDVSGPEFVDVAFIDLPGIITNADEVLLPSRLF